MNRTFSRNTKLLKTSPQVVISKTTLFLLLFLLYFNLSFAQKSSPVGEKPPACATDIMKKLQSEETKKREEEINKVIYQNNLFKKQKRAGQTYIIPVVFHIVHNGGPENISDARVLKTLQDLNQAFSNTGDYNQSDGINTDIQFCLAIQDDNGNLTSGITRTQSVLTNIDMETQDSDLKNLIRWNPNDYLNIWIIKEINSLSSGPGVAGYAYFPSSHGNLEDGIVIEAKFTGISIDYSKVLIHEAGHYLGCYHTFEGGCTNNNCLADGDHVCDTPPDASTSYVNCGATANTCNSDADDLSALNPFRPLSSGGLGDQPDMTTNYMDYNDLACVNIFTQGQKDRMIPAISIVRKSLLASKGCKSPCTSPVIMNISPVPGTAINTMAGQAITFNNTPQSNVKYDWDFGDGTTLLNTASPTKTFNTPGTYKVICKTSNSDPNCNGEVSWIVSVKCPVISLINPPATNVPLNASLSFTNASTGASTYKWYVDGILAGTSVDLTHTFTANGAHFVQLVACSGLCCDTSDVVKVQVGNCKVNHAGDVWCYGNYASVDFSSGTPISNMQTSMSQSEGVASYADQSGNLLFYTNGQQVWTASHTLMPNGNGLYGSGLSSQSSIITPFPGDPNKYYIFTVDDWQSSNSDLRCSVVDMTLNGGKGDIPAATKNVYLQNNVAERVTAVFHKNCKDIWIISHEKNNDKFVAYLLTATGVNPVPVVTNIGSATVGGNRYGYLRISHDSKKLCSTLGGSTWAPTVELFDFDNETGIVSSPVTLETAGSGAHAYSSEFSPDNRVLYVTMYDGSSIYQYDLFAGSPAQITASRIDISTTWSTKPSVQMGPDSKIYYVTSSGLGAINNPNALGTLCDAKDNAVPHMTGTYGRLGLPNFIPGIFGSDISIAGPKEVCQNSIVTYEATSSNCLNDVKWIYKGDGKVLTENKTKITIDVGSKPGDQTLSAETPGECGIISTSLSITVNSNTAAKVNLGADTAVCGPISFLLDAGSGFDTYDWSNGTTNQTLTATASGTYCVTVTNASGCLSKDCISIKSLPPFSNLDIIEDQTICNGATVSLDAGPGYNSYKWSNGSTTKSISINAPGKYWVNVKTPDNCEIADTINVAGLAAPILELGPDLGVCEGEVVVLDAGPGFKSYRWLTNGQETSKFTAYQEGKYWVTVTDTCGTHTDTVKLVNNCPLPLNILYFNSKITNGILTLNYKIADVPANAVIYIQRSKDGKSFIPLSLSYKILTENIFYLENSILDNKDFEYPYYQLVIKTSENKYLYSNIISIPNYESESSFVVFPNPSENEFTLKFNSVQESKRTIVIYTTDGRLVTKEEHEGNELQFTISADLAEGIYILTVIEESSTIVKKLRKIKK